MPSSPGGVVVLDGFLLFDFWIVDASIRMRAVFVAVGVWCLFSVVSFDCFVCSLAGTCSHERLSSHAVCCVCWWFVVGKLLRAHGGCLGIESR